MRHNIKFGLLTVPNVSKVANLGDDIQAVAARQYLPRIDVYLDRENLNIYDGDPTVVIMNGWFMHHPDRFPPSDKIIPIFESFHITEAVADVIFNQKVHDYLSKHSPIGCRDQYTAKLLQDRGIEAYYSGCLTLTLNKTDFIDGTTNEYVVFSDLLYYYRPKLIVRHFKGYLKRQYEYLRCKKTKSDIVNLMPDSIKQNAIFVTQFTEETSLPIKDRIFKAEKLLQKFANAKLVITSRLHTALPCLAFGTPVLLVLNNTHDVRFSDISEYLNIVTPERLLASLKKGVIEVGGIEKNVEDISNNNNYQLLRNKLIENIGNRINKYL